MGFCYFSISFAVGLMVFAYLGWRGYLVFVGQLASWVLLWVAILDYCVIYLIRSSSEMRSA